MKDKVKKSFSKSAMIYDEHAALQESIAEKLINKLASENISPQRILDIGAGTARDSAKLCELFPTAQVVASDIAHGMVSYAKHCGAGKGKPICFVTADMENLPFAKGKFDIIYSNAAAHWVDDLSKVFNRAKETLTKDGAFYFSTFGPRTLNELIHSFDKTYEYFKREQNDHVNDFVPFENIILTLKKAGFANITAEVERKIVKYKNVKELLKSLKNIGSYNKVGKSNHFFGKDFLRKMFDIYEENFKDNDGIYATYIVFYFTCR